MSACFHPDQNLRARTQKTLSNAASLGLGCLRFSAASCWRRARFSRSRLRRARKSRRIAPKRSPMASIMPEVVSHFACGRQRRILLKSKAGRILANDSIGKGSQWSKTMWSPRRQETAVTFEDLRLVRNQIFSLTGSAATSGAPGRTAEGHASGVYSFDVLIPLRKGSVLRLQPTTVDRIGLRLNGG